MRLLELGKARLPPFPRLAHSSKGQRSPSQEERSGNMVKTAKAMMGSSPAQRHPTDFLACLLARGCWERPSLGLCFQGLVRPKQLPGNLPLQRARCRSSKGGRRGGWDPASKSGQKGSRSRGSLYEFSWFRKSRSTMEGKLSSPGRAPKRPLTKLLVALPLPPPLPPLLGSPSALCWLTRRVMDSG